MCRMQQSSLKGKFMVTNAYSKKLDPKQPDFTTQGTRKRTKPKVNRRMERKIRVKINEMQNKSIEKTRETKRWFF